jgi:hypothetical protein
MGRPKKQPVPNPLADVDDELPFYDDAPEQPGTKPAIDPELKATLVKYPHINCVWMDESGTWFFAEKPGFTPYDREQILNG